MQRIHYLKLLENGPMISNWPKRLHAAIDKSGLCQIDIAAICEVSEGTVSLWYNANRTPLWLVICSTHGAARPGAGKYPYFKSCVPSLLCVMFITQSNETQKRSNQK